MLFNCGLYTYVHTYILLYMQTLTQAHSRPCHNNGCTEGDPALFADMLFNCGLWPIPSQPTVCHAQGYNTKLGKLAKKFALTQVGLHEEVGGCLGDMVT